MTSQFSDMTSTSNFFVSLVNFSYWSKFHVNIITGSGIMIIFYYKGMTRNPEIGNIPVWVLPNIWRLGGVIDIKFSKMSLIECYWMLQNSRVTAFTVFELWRENQLGDKITPRPTQIGVKNYPKGTSKAFWLTLWDKFYWNL